MIKTLRAKLFFIFSAFMLALVFCGILLNGLFLEDYYIYKNETLMMALSDEIRQAYETDRSNIEPFINQMDRMEGVSCLITDPMRQVRYTSTPQKLTPEEKRLPSEIDEVLVSNEKLLSKGKSIYTVIEKPQDQAAKVMLVTPLANGDLIILRKPLKGISESVSIANQFYLLAGLGIILIGGICVFIFTKTITRPLAEMSAVAESIAALKFDERVVYEAEDELGSLGQSINKMSAKLSENMAELRQDVERRKALVRNVSHELKTPIGVIKGYAEGLKYGVADDPVKTEKYCSVIVEECDRMDSLVRELLNVSLLEAGLFQMKLREVDLQALFERLLGRHQSQLQAQGIDVTLQVAPSLKIYADEELLEILINNYLVNAIHHVNAQRHIAMSATAIKDLVRIEVYNSGDPLGEADLSRIWDVFYKVDQSRTRDYGGHGLGLSIVKLIAELHGGKVGVINVPGGVVFFAEWSQEMLRKKSVEA